MASETPAPENGRLESIRLPDIQPESLEWLEPADVALSQDLHSEAVRMTVREEYSVIRLHARAAFPRSAPEDMIQLYDGNPQQGKPRLVGMLRSRKGLDKESAALLDACLTRGYVVPRIQRIIELQDEYHIIRVTVETDRGIREFIINNVFRNIESLPSGAVLFTDMDKNRYEIPDIRKMDPASRAYLSQYC